MHWRLHSQFFNPDFLLTHLLGVLLSCLGAILPVRPVPETENAAATFASPHPLPALPGHPLTGSFLCFPGFPIQQ